MSTLTLNGLLEGRTFLRGPNARLSENVRMSCTVETLREQCLDGLDERPVLRIW